MPSGGILERVSERIGDLMSEVSKRAGVTAWTGAWRLPVDKRDHQRAVRAQRRRERREYTAQKRDRMNRDS